MVVVDEAILGVNRIQDRRSAIDLLLASAVRYERLSPPKRGISSGIPRTLRQLRAMVETLNPWH